MRFRLSAWNTAAVLLIVVVTLFGLRESLRYTLLTESDQLLKDDAYEVALAIERFYPDRDEIANEMDLKARGHSDRGLFLQLFDVSGSMLISRGKLPDLSRVRLPTSAEPALVTVDGYRVVQRVVSKAGIPAYTVRVGASLANVSGEMDALTRLMLTAGIVILFVAPLSGYWLAGRATRPLARIISTAARLRPSHMNERLPIRGTDDELDQLSLTINRFLDLLGDYLDRNREFVANAAHELRSPLAALQSSVEVALNSERSVDEYQDLLGEITGECGQLRILVNQLLLLAETDASTLPLEMRPIAIDKLVDRCIDMFRGAAEERGISLSEVAPQDVYVLGNADRLRQVVNNLIDNSIKFTPPGGRVSVVLHSDFIANQLTMTVTDNGKGITPDDLPHVFERFYRGDKSRQREELTHGNGLGLSICQSIVHAHGGTMRVESETGRGATFTVTLPLWIGAQPAPADLASVAHSR
ncbi:MAG: HAMP domain-containing sensor histidine kinase [Pirellulales bacterium]